MKSYRSIQWPPDLKSIRGCQYVLKIARVSQRPDYRHKDSYLANTLGSNSDQCSATKRRGVLEFFTASRSVTSRVSAG